jgi:IS1 family transposase
MNKLPIEKQKQILHLLVEGNSLRSTSRIADVSINTVTKLLIDVGRACSEYQNKTLRNLNCKNVQIDEIWSFCYAKKANVEKAIAPVEGAGDIWTWTAIDSDSKLVMSWLVGDRTSEYAEEFIQDISSRMSGKIQITTDGHKVYINAVEKAFGCEIDYAMLIKVYGGNSDKNNEKRYSPSRFISTVKQTIVGNPDSSLVSTSYVERQNLTMRMAMRRFTRLTNGFSKKIENHEYAVALHFMYYNFARIHKTLRVSPAMQAGVTNHLWSLEEIAMLANQDNVGKKRGSYKKKISN